MTSYLQEKSRKLADALHHYMSLNQDLGTDALLEITDHTNALVEELYHEVVSTSVVRASSLIEKLNNDQLRDEFAMAALRDDATWDMSDVAERAYDVAEAMMAERERRMKAKEGHAS